MRISRLPSFNANREKEIRWLICIALALVTMAVYARVVGFEFVNYDDPEYVTNNKMVTSGLTWEGVVWAFTHVHSSNWHPLTWISHMIDCSLFGLNAGGPHAVNVLFHAANSVLVFLLILQLTGKTWRSAFVAALFALHPAHVESVAWISERKDVLSTFFGLGALLAYVDWTRSRRRSILFSGLALFTLSLLAKGMLVTLPFLLLLLDFWPLQRVENRGWRTFLSPQFRKLVIEKWPWFLLTALSCFATYYAQKTWGAVASVQNYSLSFRFGNALTAYWAYVRELFWPVNLAVFYPLPPYRLILRVGFAGLALVAASIGVCLFARKRGFLLTGWFWFVGTLVPVIGLVQVGSQSMADRYTYIPFIGLFMAVVWFVADDVFERFKIGRSLSFYSAGALLLVCAVLTFKQLGSWRNSVTLFAKDDATVGDNVVALANLADGFATAGDEDKALLCYRRAVEVAPGDPMAQANLGRTLLQKGDIAGASEHVKAALRLQPTNAVYYVDVGNVLVKEGKPELALRYFHSALVLDKKLPQAYSDLGSTLVGMGRIDEGISNVYRALQIDTNYLEGYNNLGAAFVKQKKIAEGVEFYQKALKINSTNAVARYNLGLAEEKLGQPEAALTNYQIAVISDKKHADARYELGRHLFLRGQLEDAAGLLTDAVRLKPKHYQAQLYLGLALFQLGQETDALAHLRIANNSLTNSLEALNGLAWALATAHDEKLRNPGESIALAEKAASLTQHNQPAILHTLAAAYAAGGRYDEAISTAQTALNLAQAQHLTALAASLNRELEQYRSSQALSQRSQAN